MAPPISMIHGTQWSRNPNASDSGDAKLGEDRLDARWQRPRDEREFFGDGLPRARDVLSPIELDPDDGDTDGGCRPYAAYTDRAVQRRLNRQRDERLDLERVHARRLDENRHRRRRQIGQYIERNARRRPPAPCEKGGSQRDHNRPMRERPPDEFVDHG